MNHVTLPTTHEIDIKDKSMQLNVFCFQKIELDESNGIRLLELKCLQLFLLQIIVFDS